MLRTDEGAGRLHNLPMDHVSPSSYMKDHNEIRAITHGQQVWTTGRVSKAWRDSIIILIPKKERFMIMYTLEGYTLHC